MTCTGRLVGLCLGSFAPLNRLQTQILTASRLAARFLYIDLVTKFWNTRALYWDENT